MSAEVTEAMWWTIPERVFGCRDQIIGSDFGLELTPGTSGPDRTGTPPVSR
jgi:hypothetical protein